MKKKKEITRKIREKVETKLNDENFSSKSLYSLPAENSNAHDDTKKIEIPVETPKVDEKKYEKQLKYILIILAGIIIMVFAMYFISQSSKNFEYLDLNIQKIQMGKLNLYYVEFPLKDVTGNVVGYSASYFRADPRKLGDITIDGKIRLKTTTALVADSEVVHCEDSILAGASLAQFLGKAGVKTIGATSNKTEAQELKMEYATCKDTSKYSVVEFRNSTETKITQNGDCYIVEVANCNIMNASERFMIGLYAHAVNKEIA